MASILTTARERIVPVLATAAASDTTSDAAKLSLRIAVAALSLITLDRVGAVRIATRDFEHVLFAAVAIFLTAFAVLAWAHERGCEWVAVHDATIGRALAPILLEEEAS